MIEKLGPHIDPRMTDPRWEFLEPTDFWDDWGTGFMEGHFEKFTSFNVRAGSEQDYYTATDAIDAICQAMVRYPDEEDFEIESVRT